MKRRLLAVPLLVLAAASGGCEEEAQPVPGGAEAGGVPNAPVETEIRSPQRVELRPEAGAGVRAVAMLTPREASTEVVILLQGSRPGSPHAARIYAGPCGEQGAVLAELDAVITDEGGSASSQQVVDQRPATIMGGRTSVTLYAPGGTPDQPIACGEIPHPDEAAGAAGGTMPPPVIPDAPSAAGSGGSPNP